VQFSDDRLTVLAGLCAVDTREHVEVMMAVLQKEGIVTTRMGVYKPRTNPYDFQGLGQECLPDVFHAAGQGVIAGASSVLVDFHPHREVALCDGPQALTLEQLPRFLRYVRRVREAFEDSLSD
jgi:3-deoxy-D-arabino-heptulosonate 7-phosphate (DAHP) synthase